MVRLLLDHGVSLGSKTLRAAAGSGDVDMVKRTLDSGVDINTWEAVRDLIRTALNDVIMGKASLEMISFLIDSGADINHHEANPTALEAVILRLNMELIDLLLERGAHCDSPGVLSAAASVM